ncbi:2OG-Fe(II) oxygenase [Bdellovibrio sp. GT3]|uniref:2OG-Fe(II) oxygenase n=1 Tax=Bdellovibrio sp. GT3 TaxID=3136282 RepID=UPI0030EFB902
METTLIRYKQALKFSQPWPYYLVDNFLPLDALEKFQQTMCNSKEGFQRLPDDLWEVNFKFTPDLDLARIFLSEDFKLFLESAADAELEINQKSLVQLRYMNDSSPSMPIHTDTVEYRSLVCILYLSPNWKKENGGELLLHENEKSSSEEAHIIEPIPNRMILFFSDETNWHSVNKVKNWTRYSVMSEWIVQER